MHSSSPPLTKEKAASLDWLITKTISGPRRGRRRRRRGRPVFTQSLHTGAEYLQRCDLRDYTVKSNPTTDRRCKRRSSRNSQSNPKSSVLRVFRSGTKQTGLGEETITHKRQSEGKRDKNKRVSVYSEGWSSG